MSTVLTTDSKKQLKEVKEFDHLIHSEDFKIGPKVRKLFEKLLKASKSKPHISLSKHKHTFRAQLIKRFREFNDLVVTTEPTRFKDSLEDLDQALSFKIFLTSELKPKTIYFQILQDSHDQMDWITPIIYLTNMFTRVFPGDYDGLTIYIALDPSKRTLSHPKKIKKSELFNYYQKNTLGFTVSGMRELDTPTIYLTRREQILELLVHELIHFADIDRELFHYPHHFGWATQDPIPLNEAYAEFLAQIVSTSFNAISLSVLDMSLNTNPNPIELFESMLLDEINYSLILSAKIMDFYGIQDASLFFQNQMDPVTNPIYIWSYVLLRTQLLLNLNQIEKMIGDHWKANLQVIKYMEPTEQFVLKLNELLDKTLNLENIPYQLYEIDWAKFWEKLR